MISYTILSIEKEINYGNKKKEMLTKDNGCPRCENDVRKAAKILDELEEEQRKKDEIQMYQLNSYKENLINQDRGQQTIDTYLRNYLFFFDWL